MNITEAQAFMIPRNGEHPDGQLSLSVKNTTDGKVYVWDVSDISTSELYFNLAVSLPDDITNGEYQYSLNDGNIVLSTGLLYIGSLFSPVQNESNITYQQYESE